MVCRVATVLALLRVALAAQTQDIPKWACALKPTLDEESKFLMPMGIHKLFATGNVSKDLEDVASIEKAAESLEKEEADRAKSLTKEAEAAASVAVEDAKKSEDLDAKAKKDGNNTAAAEKDTIQAVEMAKKSANASATAKSITEQAESVEAAAQMQSEQMFFLAKELKKEVEAEAKQAVQAVDGSSLQDLIAKEDVFVVFYAPWCPHCQTYVLHDEAGSAENAPIEQLNKHLKNEVKVVKFDVDANQVPAKFDVKYIPTSYFAYSTDKGIVRTKYEGDPLDFDAIAKFTSKKPSAKAAAATSSGPAITVIAQKHEVHLKANPTEVAAYEKLRAAAKLGRDMKREH